MTTAQRAETLRGLGAESRPLIARPDYVVRIITPAAPSDLLRFSAKAGTRAVPMPVANARSKAP